MKLDDPEQEPPFWLATNNAVFEHTISRNTDKGIRYNQGFAHRRLCFWTSKRKCNDASKYLKRERTSLLNELPEGTQTRGGDCSIWINESGLESDDDKRAWIMKTMNTFANVLRPRLRRWYEEARRD